MLFISSLLGTWQMFNKCILNKWLNTWIYVCMNQWMNSARTNTSWDTEEFSGSAVALKIPLSGASLVAQWLGILLPMQGTQVRALVQEDPACRRAMKPVCHNYWACTLEPTCHNYWARTPRARDPQQEKPPQWEARAPQQRVAPACHS